MRPAVDHRRAEARPDRVSLRILILLETYAPVMGGGETQARLLAEELTARGHEVLIVTRRSHPELPREQVTNGVRIQRIPPTGRSHLTKWALPLTAMPALIRKRGQYDVILVAGFRVLGIPGVLAAKLLRRPCLLKAECEGEMSGAFFGPGLARFRLTPASPPVRWALATRNQLLRRCDGFVVLSSALREELERCGVGSGRIHGIPNCVDEDLFQPAGETERAELRRGLGLARDDFVAVFTGRLVSYKGLPTLVRAWKEVATESPGARLLLVGEGGSDIHSCEAELRRFVREHGLEGRVTFTGPVTDVERYLRAADAFVFPTENEAFGIALVEAMACGLPVVTTNVGGLKDIVTDRHDALVVPPADSQALRATLGTLSRDASLRRRLGEAARRTVLDRYTRAAVASSYERLFDLVLQAMPDSRAETPAAVAAMTEGEGRRK